MINCWVYTIKINIQIKSHHTINTFSSFADLGCGIIKVIAVIKVGRVAIANGIRWKGAEFHNQ